MQTVNTDDTKTFCKKTLCTRIHVWTGRQCMREVRDAVESCHRHLGNILFRQHEVMAPGIQHRLLYFTFSMHFKRTRCKVQF